MAIALLAANDRSAQGAKARGVRLETHTWVEAQALLDANAVVVVPLGAVLKEHGPHLKLRNDLTLAEHFTRRIVESSNVVATPPLTYHFYPAFMEYPGSTTLTLETARDMTAQVVRSLARYGPRRFYVLNTGISTARPLQAAAAALAAEGILMRYTDFGAHLEQASARIRQQEGGSHADEIETSMMLHIDPASVDMKSAVRDFSPVSTPVRLTRRQGGPGTYSPTGTWGDPTLATATKGRIIVDGVVERMLEDIELLRKAIPPDPQAVPAEAPAPAPAARRQSSAPSARPERCTAGDQRAIVRLADAFNIHWMNADAVGLAALWAEEGDIVHPDGASERGRQTIQQNRHEQFMRKEYRHARYTLTLGNVRCLTADVAVADGKWVLRGVVDRLGNPAPPGEGLVTVVVKRRDGPWLFEAYRYTVTQQGPVPPTLLKKPGYPPINK
jgi:creatinine amidohydrolase